MLPLLSLPCAFGVARFPRTGIVLAAVSIFLTTQATLVRACLGQHDRGPVLEFFISTYREGKIEPNLGTIAGLSSLASVIFFYVILVAGMTWLVFQASRFPAANGAQLETSPTARATD